MEYFGMDTYFSKYQKPFPHQTMFKIKTVDFIIPCKDFLHMLHDLSFVFTIPRITMQTHLDKVIKKYDQDLERYQFLEEMILSEKDDVNSQFIDSLLHLRRYLQFFLEYFEGICNDELLQEDTTVIAKVAYSNSLEIEHGWFMKLLFNITIWLFPKRKQLLSRLGFHTADVQEFVLYDMNEFTLNLRCCVNQLTHIYLVNGLEVIPLKKKFKLS